MEYLAFTGDLTWPSGMRLWVDGEDITNYAFGTDTINPDLVHNKWNDIDLSMFVKNPGRHVITVSSETPGTVDVRVEIR
jgi:hypothetical protein